MFLNRRSRTLWIDKGRRSQPLRSISGFSYRMSLRPARCRNFHIYNVTTSDERSFLMHGFFTGISNWACILTAANHHIGVLDGYAHRLGAYGGGSVCEGGLQGTRVQYMYWGIFEVVVLACSRIPLSSRLVGYGCPTTIVICTQLFR